MPHRPVRPLDAAGLLLIRDNGGPEVLLGRRRRAARAFPGEYVFPGGLVDAADKQPSGFAEDLSRPKAGLDRSTRDNLQVFARTALRECFEETGLLVTAGGGRAAAADLAPARGVWRSFAERSIRPAFEALLPVARAITPRGYPRRFHSRFFLALIGGRVQAQPADPAGGLAGDGELEDLAWVPVAQTRRIPLAGANAVVLQEVLAGPIARHRAGAPWPGCLAGTPAPCFTWRGQDQRQFRTIIGAAGV